VAGGDWILTVAQRAGGRPWISVRNCVTSANGPIRPLPRGCQCPCSQIAHGDIGACQRIFRRPAQPRTEVTSRRFAPPQVETMPGQSDNVCACRLWGENLPPSWHAAKVACLRAASASARSSMPGPACVCKQQLPPICRRPNRRLGRRAPDGRLRALLRPKIPRRNGSNGPRGPCHAAERLGGCIPRFVERRPRLGVWASGLAGTGVGCREGQKRL